MKVIDDCLQMIQTKEDSHATHFIKLEVVNPEVPGAILEFTKLQLTQNRIYVIKELAKNLEKSNININLKCVFKLSKDLGGVVG
jgi:hypothetical protein